MDKTRTIVTKNKTYILPIENKGIAIEDYWPDTNIPADMKGARVYETKDGTVIARQPSEDFAPRSKAEPDRDRKGSSPNMSAEARALLDSYRKDDFKKVRQENEREQDNNPQRNRDDDRER